MSPCLPLQRFFDIYFKQLWNLSVGTLVVNSPTCCSLFSFLLFVMNRDSQEKFVDSDYVTAPTLSKMFSSSVDPSSRRFHCDEAEFLEDNSVAKPLSEQVEALTDSPVHNPHIDEHETILDIDVSHRKMAKDKYLDTSTDDSFINTMKISKDMDVALGKAVSDDLNTEIPLTKMYKDIKGSFKDNITSRNIYKEKCDLPLDMRKMLRAELEASTDTQRKISRSMMGASMDSIPKTMSTDDAERMIESRRITRSAMGMSQDTGPRKNAHTGESHLDSSVREGARDKKVESARIPLRKLSRDELESYNKTAAIKMLPREMLDEHMDTLTSADLQEFCLGQSASKGMRRNESEVSLSSLRRRIPRMPRDDANSLTDTSTGNISRDRIDVPLEIPKQPMLMEEMRAFESSSLPYHIGQPDLMLTSQSPWKSSSDLYNTGPLSQLVYDGILEKSCSSMASTPTTLSASTPVLPQSWLQADIEPPVPPPKAVIPSLASPPEGRDDKIKDRDKSKKTLKLKNLFKKKNESPPEKLQSGLQKL